MRDRHHIAEEPCAVKVASTVLETGGAGDGPAEFNRPASRPRGANHQHTSDFYAEGEANQRTKSALPITKRE